MKLLWILTFVSSSGCLVSAQTNGDIRLSGLNSNSSQGRVEVYYNGAWGTVCDDGFSSSEAIVICRQLGTSGDPSNAKPVLDGRFGAGAANVDILIDDLNCEGTEARLVDCPFGGWGQTDCTHSEDVGVICPTSSVTPGPTVTPPPTEAPVVPGDGNCTVPDANIRLIGPANLPGVGVVQIKRNNDWGGVCDNDWDILDARVVCRMLCLDPLTALAGSVAFDTSKITEPMTVDNVRCSGNEASITDCPQSPWAVNSCQRSEMAKVTCVPLDNSPPSRPDPLLDCSNGMMSASFARSRDPFLEEKHLSVALTYTGPCNSIKSTDTDYVVISIPFDECGTQRSSNTTHIIYQTTIKYSPTSSSGAISNANTYMVQVKCEMPREVLADKPIVPLTETVTQVAPGEFVVNMHFYRNNSFVTAVTQFPLEIPLGEWLSTALQLIEVDSHLKLVVPNCYATPTANKNDQVQYPLFTDKCSNDQTVGFFPINDTWFGYRYQTFRFVQYQEVYIHCDTYICEKNDTSPECDRSCFPTTTTASPGTERRRRSISGPRFVHVMSPTIIVYDSHNPSNEIIRPELPPTTVRPISSASETSILKSSPIITRMTSTPKITTQSQTASNHVTQTESFGDEMFVVGDSASSVQLFMPYFVLFIAAFAMYFF